MIAFKDKNNLILKYLEEHLKELKTMLVKYYFLCLMVSCPVFPDYISTGQKKKKGFMVLGLFISNLKFRIF